MKRNKKIVNEQNKEYLTRTEKLKKTILIEESLEVRFNNEFVKCLPTFNSVKNGFLIVDLSKKF